MVMVRMMMTTTTLMMTTKIIIYHGNESYVDINYADYHLDLI